MFRQQTPEQKDLLKKDTVFYSIICIDCEVSTQLVDGEAVEVKYEPYHHKGTFTAAPSEVLNTPQ